MTVIPIRNLKEAPKAAQSRMETAIITLGQAREWRIPPFQRPLRVNTKVLTMAEEMKANALEINGVITLGQVKNDPTIWLVDGQHRTEAFKLSGLTEIIADLRLCRFDSMADMAEEFVRLNSSIVKMRPDDILRGLEENCRPLAKIRHDCGFVGYDNIRRNASGAPIVGMSALLRCWAASAGETPATSAGNSASNLATSLTDESTEHLIRFLLTAYSAWGRDPEYYRLWGNLNLTLCMWLWRKLVMDRERTIKRYVVLGINDFKKCLMSVSAASDYIDWLQGRNLSDRDRTPCYSRLKAIFVRRLAEESRDRKKLMLPQPAWAHS